VKLFANSLAMKQPAQEIVWDEEEEDDSDSDLEGVHSDKGQLMVNGEWI